MVQERLQYIAAVQLAVPFGDVAQGVHDVVPHELTLLLDAHAPEQT